MSIFISLSVIFWSLFPSLISYTQGTQPPQKIKLTNLVSNGDLLTPSTTNVNIPKGFISSTNTNISLINGVFTFTPISRYGQLARPSNAGAIIGNVYYLFSYVKSSSTETLLIGYGYSTSFLKKHSGNGQWELLSVVGNKTNTDNRIEVQSNLLTDFSPIQVDYIGLINLTSVFGVGNEPSKAYMDELINDIGYFEGDYYYTTSLDDNYKWFSTGFVEKTGERDFLDYLGFFVWLAVPPISIYLLYKLMKGLIYE